MLTLSQYNHTRQNYFNVVKERPYCLVMATAKEVARECLPIKCVEAVMLALWLTNGWSGLARFPLRFKTKFDRHTYR
jgi:hypothetical protein